MMAGFSPLIWITGGVSDVDDAASPAGVEYAKKCRYGRRWICKVVVG
jgi:hypothetical protein